MKTNRAYSAIKQMLLVMATIMMALLGSRPAAAQEKPKPKGQVLHSFQENGQDGILPQAGLIFDSAGNLYGATGGGGSENAGTVFELSPQSGGGWTEKILYGFQSNGQDHDGAGPLGSLIFDKSGNLYGTTFAGGTEEWGTVFELSPQSGGGWTEKILHSFTAGSDGAGPAAGLIFDSAGNLYGTTEIGGTGVCGGGFGCGTVFELSPQSGGDWTERVLYAFCSQSDCTDGAGPYGGVILDSAGNLYGTTVEGGDDADGCPAYGGGEAGGCGTVFELSPQSGGAWTETVLHRFKFAEGFEPDADLTFDAAGNLYGTAAFGGTGQCPKNVFGGCGSVFELSPGSGGVWSATVLHSFQPNGGDGRFPVSTLVFDAAGNLYGTTNRGGANGGANKCLGGAVCGTIFELSPRSNGPWAEKVFSFNGEDGRNPPAGVIFDKAGNLYGTTRYGGTGQCGIEPRFECGTVFEITR